LNEMTALPWDCSMLPNSNNSIFKADTCRIFALYILSIRILIISTFPRLCAISKTLCHFNFSSSEFAMTWALNQYPVSQSRPGHSPRARNTVVLWPGEMRSWCFSVGSMGHFDINRAYMAGGRGFQFSGWNRSDGIRWNLERFGRDD
jgi:hypothetical protein